MQLTPMRINQGLFAKLCITFFSFIISCVLFENIARFAHLPRANFFSKSTGGALFIRLKNDNFFSLSNSRIYGLSSGSINNFRLNPKDITPTARSDYKILAIGDSFTYGHGVNDDETYPVLLEELLKNNGIQVKVDNAGVPGYGPDQEYAYIQELLHHASDYDVILWNINVNDPVDANSACLFRKTPFGYIRFPGNMNLLYHMVSYVRSRNEFVNQSYFLNYFFAALRGFVQRDRFTFGCSKLYPDNKEMIHDYQEKLLYFAQNLQHTFRKEKMPTQLVFVLVPHRPDIIPGNATSNTRSYKEFADTMAKLLHSRENIFFNASRGVASTLISLQETEQASISSGLFLHEPEFGDNPHLSASGNASFANTVSSWLLANIFHNDKINK